MVVADPLLDLHLWLPRVSADALSILGADLLGRRVGLTEIRALRQQPMFSAIGPHEPTVPEALAQAFQRALRRSDRRRVQQREAALVAAVRGSHRLTAPERVRLLGSWGDWVGVDRVLAHHMRLLATLSPLQRQVLLTQWPPQAPRRLVHLAKARAFLAGDWDRVPVPPGTGTAWAELAFLIGSEVVAPADSLTERIRRRFGSAQARRVYSIEGMRAVVDELIDWLGDEVHRVENSPTGVSNCDVLLIAMLVGAIDTAVRVGLMPEAQRCLRRALRLSQATATPGSRPVMWPEIVARAAFLSAKGGLRVVARTHLDEYDELVAVMGRRDVDTERLAHIARRYITCPLELSRDPGMRIVEPAQPLGAHEAEVEALRVILTHGTSAGGEWIRSFLTRAAWSSRPDWAWWPLYSVMALLEAREGNADAAERWLERQPLPVALETPDPERDALIAGEHWGATLGAVVLFPDRVRRLVEPRLLAPLADLPGLALPGVEPSSVVLTPRQLDVLRALESDATMPQIAVQLAIGVETVRSTAKDLYRRMGVHGRGEAVALGRELRLV